MEGPEGPPIKLLGEKFYFRALLCFAKLRASLLQDSREILLLVGWPAGWLGGSLAGCLLDFALLARFAFSNDAAYVACFA